ncbi:MAG: NAD(P)-dependent oxidoreductase [Pusillimonas sp.]|nr:NAD(P)-dependent oxidoreductase [Pusillimonas sp.]
MAINLIKSGTRVVGYRRTNTQPFVEAGGVLAASPAEVVEQTDVVLLCLPNDQAALQVLEGEHGIMGRLSASKTFIETGTYSKAFKLAQARQIQSKGARYLEAEISGSPPMIAARKASFYAGGDEALFHECEPLLRAITDQCFYLGPLGSAVAMKLIANYLLAIHTLSAAEAMNMGKRAGFDPHLVAKVIQAGAGASAMFGVRAPLMADRKFEPALGPFAMLEKYLVLGRGMADDLGCATPLFSAAVPYFKRAFDEGIQHEDIAAVIKFLEADSQKQEGAGGA